MAGSGVESERLKLDRHQRCRTLAHYDMHNSCSLQLLGIDRVATIALALPCSSSLTLSLAPSLSVSYSRGRQVAGDQPQRCQALGLPVRAVSQ